MAVRDGGQAGPRTPTAIPRPEADRAGACGHRRAGGAGEGPSPPRARPEAPGSFGSIPDVARTCPASHGAIAGASSTSRTLGSSSVAIAARLAVPWPPRPALAADDPERLAGGPPRAGRQPEAGFKVPSMKPCTSDSLLRHQTPSTGKGADPGAKNLASPRWM